MSEVGERLIWAATRTLRPMVKRLLQMGIPFGALELRLRELFVEVAESELALPDRRQTDSSISLVTGINRKEVKHIRSSKDQLKAPRSFGINQATSLVSRWMTDPETTDQHGRPRPLPYRARRGPSFMKLARKLTGDLAPGVLLNELVRSGAAELLEGDIVVLRGDAYVPKARPSEFLILGEDPAELIETILRNIFAGEKSGCSSERFTTTISAPTPWIAYAPRCAVRANVSCAESIAYSPSTIATATRKLPAGNAATRRSEFTSSTTPKNRRRRSAPPAPSGPAGGSASDHV